MKRKSIIALCFFIYSLTAAAQQIPDLKLDNLDGTTINLAILNNQISKVTLLSFWATWCIPCINELSAINDNLPDWKKKHQFDFYAVSVDDSRTISRVKPLVNGKNWDFAVLLDKNQELKRQLNVMNVPYTIIVKEGKIIYRHSGFVFGDEDELLKIIKDNQ
ncbi:MAG: TlpA disulfide reductase family protein [Ferruginibacter sp.]